MATERQHGLVAWNIRPNPVKKPKSVKPRSSQPSVTLATLVGFYLGGASGLGANVITDPTVLPGLVVIFGLAAVCAIAAGLLTHRINRKRPRR